jgi:predicted polyphosphate/ATP-dependent NAD kinase
VEKSEMEKKIKEDPDFIHSPKHQNSLQKFLAKNDRILEDGAVGRLLLIPESEVERIYQESIVELRKEMVDEERNSD